MQSAMKTPSPRKLSKPGHFLCDTAEAAPMNDQSAAMILPYEDRVLFGAVESMDNQDKIIPYAESNEKKRRRLNCLKTQVKAQINTLKGMLRRFQNQLNPVNAALNAAEREARVWSLQASDLNNKMENKKFQKHEAERQLEVIESEINVTPVD